MKRRQIFSLHPYSPVGNRRRRRRQRGAVCRVSREAKAATRAQNPRRLPSVRAMLQGQFSDTDLTRTFILSNMGLGPRRRRAITPFDRAFCQAMLEVNAEE